jgi:hypothetical protein
MLGSRQGCRRNEENVSIRELKVVFEDNCGIAGYENEGRVVRGYIP